MLSETAARFVYPNQDPVGRPMLYDFDVLGIARGDSRVVAVVRDVNYRGLDAPRADAVYVPWQRVPTGVSYIVVRTTGDPLALFPSVRDLILASNPSLPVPEVRTLADHVAGSIADRRLRVVPAAGCTIGIGSRSSPTATATCSIVCPQTSISTRRRCAWP